MRPPSLPTGASLLMGVAGCYAWLYFTGGRADPGFLALWFGAGFVAAFGGARGAALLTARPADGRGWLTVCALAYAAGGAALLSLPGERLEASDLGAVLLALLVLGWLVGAGAIVVAASPPLPDPGAAAGVRMRRPRRAGPSPPGPSTDPAGGPHP